MSTASWQHYEHEADIGVLGIGGSLADAFAQAALAMTAIITDPGSVSADIGIDIECKADDPELLFVDWLNALIFQMSTQKMLFSRFDVDIRSGQLHARAWGEKIDQHRHQPVVEIKGATFTTLRVQQDDQGNWRAQTVVDV